MSKTITKKMTFQEAMLIDQIAGLIFLKYGLHCIGCHMSADESIEDGARAHGLDDKEISKMVKEINEKIKQLDKSKKKSKSK